MRSVFTHYGKYFFKGKRIAIGAFGAKGVEDVGDGQDARGDRKLIGFQALPITFAVEAFVMGRSVETEIGERGNAAENFVRVIRMLANGLEFLVGELAAAETRLGTVAMEALTASRRIRSWAAIDVAIAAGALS